MARAGGGRGAAESGVYYERRDYAGFWVRLLVDIVDIAVFAVLFGLLALLFSLLPTADPGLEIQAAFLSGLPLAFWYFVLLKRSRFRTVGYVLGRVRIVSLQGQRPGIGALVLRLLFAILGPVNFLIDIIWIPSDPAKQALRDKFAHTYVIRKDAQPAGRGKVAYATYDVLGMMFLFPFVRGPHDEAHP